jgi:hypothetical protein
MRSKKNRWNSRHHRFPKCEWWTMHYDNLVAMGKCRHQALHILFDEHWKATMPHRQIEIYLWLMWKAIITDAKEEIQSILDTYWMDLYNPKCVRR